MWICCLYYRMLVVASFQQVLARIHHLKACSICGTFCSLQRVKRERELASCWGASVCPVCCTVHSRALTNVHMESRDGADGSLTVLS